MPVRFIWIMLQPWIVFISHNNTFNGDIEQLRIRFHEHPFFKYSIISAHFFLDLGKKLMQNMDDSGVFIPKKYR